MFLSSSPMVSAVSFSNTENLREDFGIPSCHLWTSSGDGTSASPTTSTATFVPLATAFGDGGAYESSVNKRSNNTPHQTTLLISNLHCPSCITTIERVLFDLNPKPLSISHSLVNHSIIICHGDDLPVTLICNVLENAGYDLDSVIPDSRSPDADLFSDIDTEDQSQGKEVESPWPFSFLRRPGTSISQQQSLKRKRHIENCDLCRAKCHDGEDHDTVTFKDRKPTHRSSVGSISTRSLLKLDHKNSTEPNDRSTSTTRPLQGISGGAANAEAASDVQISISGMTCSACVSNILEALQGIDWIDRPSISVNLVSNSASLRIHRPHDTQEVVDIIHDLGYEAAVQDVKEATVSMPVGEALSDTDKVWQAFWAIEGMTCSACVSAITTALKDISYIRKVDVNLVGNAATTIITDRKHVDEIKEAIEDLGYEATVVSVDELQVARRATARRKVTFRVTGMYCERCPPRIRGALNELGGDLIVEKMPTMVNPILHVDYVPVPPLLTIRTILSAISAADAALEVSVYHPPTIEEKSRGIHVREQRLILVRVVLTLVLAIPTFIIGIVYMDLVSDDNTTRRYLMTQDRGVARAEWILLALSTPVYFFGADLFHRRTLKELRALWRPGSSVPYARRFLRFGSMNMLVSLGTSIAYWASIGILAASASRPDNDNDSTKYFYFDSVVFLTLFLLCGRLMEAYSKAKTGNAVAMLGKLRPETALLLVDEKTAVGEDRVVALEPTSVDLLELGDIVRVPHGSSPPFDGCIVEGSAMLDESSLTGESRQVRKTMGDTVYSGTINTGNAISIELTGIAGNSMLDQIIKVVREGQARRAPVERLADLITGHFVPVVTLISVITWIVWLALGLGGALAADYLDTPLGGWPYWSLQFAIAVFVVACPCGIGLAAPTALFVGGGLAAKHGILVKGGGEAFQEASKIDIVVFDKTGTLTMGGEPQVSDHKLCITVNEPHLSKKQLIGMIKRLEEDSGHPLARAVVAWCASQEHDVANLAQSREIAGKGMYGRFGTSLNHEMHELLIGNTALLEDHNISIPSIVSATLTQWTTAAKSIILVAARTGNSPYSLVAALATSDPIRPSAPSIISTLQTHHNITTWMLTGDNAATAAAVGAQLGIPPANIIAGILPAEKAEKIRWLQKSQPSKRKGKRAIVAMLGDGTNDAPALAAADVSIAISHTSGSDIAISTASFVLLQPDLDGLVTLLDLSRAVFRRIMFNFGWALVYNCVSIPVAAGMLYPIRSGGGHVRLDPVWAALAMALSSVSVVGSSLLLRSGLPLVGFRARR